MVEEEPETAAVVHNHNVETPVSVTESKESTVVYSDCDEQKMKKISSNEVETWLEGLELQQYVAKFAENGFASMDLVQNISEEQKLISIGIEDKYHRKAILRGILQINNRNTRRMSVDVDCIVILTDDQAEGSEEASH